jgi:outer membrane lipoprotein carrier protein
MKKTILIISWLVILSQISIAQPDSKAKLVLDAVKKKYQAMSAFKATFTYTIDSKASGASESLEGEITLKGTKFYLKLPQQEIITDGKTQWTFLKEPNEVNVTDYEPDDDEITPDKIYTIYETNYDYSYVEEKFENGKKYHIIELKPKNRNANVFKIRLKVVKDANSIKSWEIFERNSNRYLYTITKFATVTVGDGYFKYVPTNYPSKPVLNDLR